MNLYDRVSTGIKGFDEVIDHLRLGDNVVWQVDSVSDYKKMVEYFVQSSKTENMRAVYVRFANHAPIIDENMNIETYHINPKIGFESFTIEIHNLIKEQGKRVLYIFDCLTDLLEYWYSDLMIGNFLRLPVRIYMTLRRLHILQSGGIITHTAQLPESVRQHSFSSTCIK